MSDWAAFREADFAGLVRDEGMEPRDAGWEKSTVVG